LALYLQKLIRRLKRSAMCSGETGSSRGPIVVLLSAIAIGLGAVRTIWSPKAYTSGSLSTRIFSASSTAACRRPPPV